MKTKYLIFLCCIIALFSCSKQPNQEVNRKALDSAYQAGYSKGLTDAQTRVADQPKEHRPGHIQMVSAVMVRSGTQDIINYGLVEDDSTHQQFFFFNINDSGQQIRIKQSDRFFFERLVNAPKIRFGGTCYELAYPIGVNLGPNDHSHPCDPNQYVHQH